MSFEGREPVLSSGLSGSRWSPLPPRSEGKVGMRRVCVSARGGPGERGLEPHGDLWRPPRADFSFPKMGACVVDPQRWGEVRLGEGTDVKETKEGEHFCF